MGTTYEQAEADPERYKILKNGVIYDMETKRFCGMPGGGKSAITKQNAGEMQAQAQLVRKDKLRAAANSAVERQDLVTVYGDDAYAAEIVAAMQAKATNIDDPKSVSAARFVFKQTGIDAPEIEQPGHGSELQSVLEALLHRIHDLIAAPETVEVVDSLPMEPVSE